MQSLERCRAAVVEHRARTAQALQGKWDVPSFTSWREEVVRRGMSEAGVCGVGVRVDAGCSVQAVGAAAVVRELDACVQYCYFM
jgi:hypothetical protein